jgi:glycosyltransferase involved in cell wall biosynthesis
MEHPAHIDNDTMQDKIYIIVPVFNRKSFMQRFLYCMREQTFRNFDIIVVDDCSIDDTAELIKTWS